MTPEFVMGLARQALETFLAVSLPVLLISLVVGLLISILQAVTQIQEMTLSFVPKVIVTGLALLLLGAWMMNKLADLTRSLIEGFPNMLR